MAAPVLAWHHSVCAEPVEACTSLALNPSAAPARAWLHSVRAEPVEACTSLGPNPSAAPARAWPHSVRAEPVEACTSLGPNPSAAPARAWPHSVRAEPVEHALRSALIPRQPQPARRDDVPLHLARATRNGRRDRLQVRPHEPSPVRRPAVARRFLLVSGTAVELPV